MHRKMNFERNMIAIYEKLFPPRFSSLVVSEHGEVLHITNSLFAFCRIFVRNKKRKERGKLKFLPTLAFFEGAEERIICKVDVKKLLRVQKRFFTRFQ